MGFGILNGRKRGKNMSKFLALWEYVGERGESPLKLTFQEIQGITGVPMDHSFLGYKKELLEYGYRVERISRKEQTVLFCKAEQ